MPYVLLGILALIALLAIGRIFVTTPVASLVQAFKWMSVALVSAAGIYFVASGRLGWALIAAPAVVPILNRAFRAAKMRQAFNQAGGSGANPMGLGQTSEVRTRFLRMVLDHDTGEMNGDVLNGRFAGHTLRNLSLADLLALLGECRGDEESVQVLTAYLDRYHGDTWRDQAEVHERAAPKSSDMTRDEAFEILGLPASANQTEIKAAHHRLMSKIHPDHGGSTYLAAKINQAKDLLLST
jgi:hypothetical protein